MRIAARFATLQVYKYSFIIYKFLLKKIYNGKELEEGTKCPERMKSLRPLRLHLGKLGASLRVALRLYAELPHDCLSGDRRVSRGHGLLTSKKLHH